MVFQCKQANHRMLFTGFAALAATLILAACGGGGPSATVTNAPTATTIATSAASVPASGRQTGLTPTSAPAAIVSATVRQSVPTAPPTDVAGVAAAATKRAAPNAKAGSVAGKVDPCTLITKADYVAVIGDAANDPEKKAPAVASTGFTRSSCQYKIASADKVEFVTVYVMQRDAGAPAQIDMKTYWEGTKKTWASQQAKVTPLPEIGPEVFLVTTPTLEQIGAGGAIHFFKGDVIFDITAVTGNGTVDEQNTTGTTAAKKLATIAFARL